MKYFKLLKDYQIENEMFCSSEDQIGWEQYELSEGKYIDDWGEENTFYYDPREGTLVPDYLNNDLSWFIVSPKFKNLLVSIENNGVQFLPINIINKENNTSHYGFSVANVLNVVDAINYDKSAYSVFELDDEKVYDITKYALNGNSINGKHIFKLKGDEIPLFVSEKLKDLIEFNKIIGCDFLEVTVI